MGMEKEKEINIKNVRYRYLYQREISFLVKIRLLTVLSNQTTLVNLDAERRFNEELSIPCVTPSCKNGAYPVISVSFFLSLMRSCTRLSRPHSKGMVRNSGTMIMYLCYIYDYYDYIIIIILYLPST